MYKSMIRQVVQAYSGRIVKTYIYLRFKIINPSILEAMLSDFQPDRRALILGCGFGLFDLVLGLRWPEKVIRGIDINEGRLQAAREAAARLGLRNNAFEFMDLSRDDVRLGGCDEILLWISCIMFRLRPRPTSCARATRPCRKGASWWLRTSIARHPSSYCSPGRWTCS